MFESCENRAELTRAKRFFELPSWFNNVFGQRAQNGLDWAYDNAKKGGSFGYESVSYYSPVGGLNFHNLDWSHMILSGVEAKSPAPTKHLYDLVVEESKMIPNYTAKKKN